jgi:hypothetical protein
VSFIRIVLEVRQDVKKEKIDNEEEDFNPDVFVSDDISPAGSVPIELFLQKLTVGVHSVPM